MNRFSRLARGRQSLLFGTHQRPTTTYQQRNHRGSTYYAWAHTPEPSHHSASQTWFDRGLLWSTATTTTSRCAVRARSRTRSDWAMAHGAWPRHGSNYNKPWRPSSEERVVHWRGHKRRSSEPVGEHGGQAGRARTDPGTDRALPGAPRTEAGADTSTSLPAWTTLRDRHAMGVQRVGHDPTWRRSSPRPSSTARRAVMGPAPGRPKRGRNPRGRQGLEMRWRSATVVQGAHPGDAHYIQPWRCLHTRRLACSRPAA